MLYHVDVEYREHLGKESENWNSGESSEPYTITPSHRTNKKMIAVWVSISFFGHFQSFPGLH